jgi:UDPglucose--hexose-1-phosphate uridylyltransferase
MTPPETIRVGHPWQVRAFPNKYPATEHHEVVVESPVHDATFDAIPHAVSAVDALIDRYRALAQHTAHVTIFKNHGLGAGASIPHLHTQILGTPFVPPRVEREAAASAGRCALCSAQEPLIRETANYRWIAPRGSLFAWEQWIVPRQHTNEIGEPLELAELLQASVAKMRSITPAFNWIFMNFPRAPHAHAYVQLFPRFAVHAGFELGSGSSINAVSADETVKRFR